MESTNRVGNLIKTFSEQKMTNEQIHRWLSSTILFTIYNPIYTEDYRKEYLYDLATIYSLISNQKIENMLDDRG
jgi:hypothetical protein